MARITLTINKNIEENAVIYYEKSKKAKKKLEGLKTALNKAYKDLAKFEVVEEKKEETVQKVVRKKEWYEKFRWFFASNGMLAIGGRDATTNEIVIKKYTESHDIVFHTDMAGSPFFVLKTEGKAVPKNIMKEVADATCTFSRAFKLGLSSQSVFYVTPEQVSKEANQGEYLTKGAFMIRGKTNYTENNINCAIGQLEDGKMMCAPLESIKKHCRSFLIIEQGDKKPSEIAKFIKKEFNYPDLDEIVRILPPSNIAIRK